MSEISQLIEVQRQTRKPFQKRPRCPKCGSRTKTLMARLLELLALAHTAEFPVRYCAGGRPPSEDHHVGIFSITKDNICAGVTSEHLHRICSNCGFDWLSEVKS